MNKCMEKSYINDLCVPSLNYSELFKLDRMLSEYHIPHDLHKVHGFGWQITYAKDGTFELRKPGCGDAVINETSYGHEEGLIEIMGFDIDEKIYGDEVIGWLTAEKAFVFFERQYKKDAMADDGQQKMKTLDEVIKACEICSNVEKPECSKCPYFPGKGWCEEKDADAAYYLNEYRKILLEKTS